MENYTIDDNILSTLLTNPWYGVLGEEEEVEVTIGISILKNASRNLMEYFLARI